MAALQTRRLSLRMHCAHDAPRRWGKLPVRQFRRKLRETWLTTERHIHIYNIDTYIHRHIYTYIHVYVDRHIIAPWPDTSQWSKPDKAPSTKCYKLIPTCSVRGLWIYVYVCLYVYVKSDRFLCVFTSLLLLKPHQPLASRLSERHLYQTRTTVRKLHWSVYDLIIQLFPFNLANEKQKNESIFRFSVFLYAPNIEDVFPIFSLKRKTETK